MQLKDNLKPGYLLYRRKGIVKHAGVYLGNSLVFHHSPTAGTEIISFDAYANGQVVDVVAIDSRNREVLIERLQQLMQANARYNPITANCEHLANALLYGRSFSPQLQVIINAALIGGTVGLRLGRGNSMLMALLSGVAGCIATNVLRKKNTTIPNLVASASPWRQHWRKTQPLTRAVVSRISALTRRQQPG